MAYPGHCNCESVRITLPEQPPNSVVCHCACCKRAGGSFSINYMAGEDEMTVEDPTNALKIYNDKNTASGNVIKRYFCSNCGSPAFTKTPLAPGKVFLKASLFDQISPCRDEVFDEERLQWLNVERVQKA